MQNAPFFMLLLIGFLITFSQAIAVDLGSNARGIVMDTRSSTLFISTDNTEIWSVENSDYVHKLTQLAGSGAANLAMVDFLHQDLGWMYGLLAATKLTHVVHFVSLTAGASPPAQANLFAGVAGVSGSSGSVDGVGGAARLNEPGWLAAAHTAPRWFVSTPPARSIRGLEFPLGVGVQLSVSTVFTHATLTIDAVGISADDSVLYFYESAGSGDLFKLSDPLTTVGATSAVLVATSVAHACQMFVHPTSDILLVANGSSNAYVVSTVTGLIQSTVATSGLSRAAFVHPNGTELYGMAGTTDNLHTHCCQTAYDESYNWATASTQPVPNSPPQVYDIQFDARSSTVFYSTNTEVRTMYGSAIASSIGTGVHFAMVDTIVCGFGRAYGVMSTSQDHAVRFAALSPGPPPTSSGSPLVVAGQSGVSGTSDGIGSAALFNSPSFIAGAHTVARWVIGGNLGNGVRCATFVGSTPQLALNVSTIAGTGTRQATGVALTADDRILYFVDAASNSLFYVTGPLTASPTPSSAVATYGTAPQQLLLDASGKYLVVGVAGDVLFTSSLTAAFKVQRFGTAAVVLPNGTVLTGSPSMNMRKWCCLPVGDYSNHAVAIRVSFNLVRDFAHDTRSAGLFGALVTGPILYLSLDPITRTVAYNMATMPFIAMVDFIHCSGPIYGILVSQQTDHKMSFLPLTPAAAGVPPVAATRIDVAGDGTDADVDGVGSAARLGSLGYVTAAHTVPAWLVGGLFGERFRRVVFTNDMPLRLNVTTILATPGKQSYGMTVTNDDSILYASIYNLQQIVTVLNPLSVNPTLGPVLSIAATYIHTVSLHPGCESLLLVGCYGEYLLVYNITSQSTVHSIHALDSYNAGFYNTDAGTVLANGTVIFAGYASSLNALASWCCLPSYSSSLTRSYAPSIPAIAVPAPSTYNKDIVHDTRSEGLFASNGGVGIQYLSLNPLSSTIIYSLSNGMYLSMVDFIRCSGPVYGMLMTYQVARKISFLPLTPAAPGVPPVAGTVIDVAGDGTNGNLDGVGSAARFSIPLCIAGAHTAPAWIVADMGIRLVVFTNDVPLRLNVTTLISTPSQQPHGVVFTHDDSILYASVYNLDQINTVFNPLSSSPTLGPVLPIVANSKYKISLHPGCESLLLVGCQGEYLLVYNITSQSTAYSIHALDSYSAVGAGHYTEAGTVLANGTVIFTGYSVSTKGLASWCCLPPYSTEKRVSYTAAVSLRVPSTYTRDIIHDTRSNGLLLCSLGTGIKYLTLNPVSSTTFFSTTDYMAIAIVDFIHCSGPTYGILIAFVVSHRISFLPLTPAASGTPPLSGSLISVAGDGTDANVDGVGSAARFNGMGYIAAAHTAPVWIVGGYLSQSIRLAMFTNDVPLRLNVTTLIATPANQLVGVVTTYDDSILYGADHNSGQIITVLNPLSSNPTLGPVLSIVAVEIYKISLHPGCESLLLVGCKGEYLLVYNITSQSSIQGIRALDSAYSGDHWVPAGTVLANGTVIFAGYGSSLDALASWCCLPSYNSSMKATYAPPVAPTPLALSSDYFRDVIRDTQSGGLFTVNSGDNIRYLSLNQLTSANVFYTGSDRLYVAMVDFIHCSGPTYGILIAYQDAFKISFLPLTPAAAGVPPVAGTLIDVAGNGTSGNVDGVGSTARVRELGHVACAHTAPTWIFGGWVTESIRRASFATDFRLNLTTLIATPGKQPFGVVTTNDDSVLYASVYNLQQIVIVLNPLSPSCSLGTTLSIVANGMHKITLHPGCETLLLVGCTGDALLLYNITSQSVVRSLTAVASAPFTLAGTILTNGTVIFGAYTASPLVSWCCLPRYDSSTLPAYSRFVPATTLPGSSSYTQDIVHDTRSGGLFSSHDGTGIQYLTLNPFSNTTVYTFTTSAIQSAMVDFIHCSGPIYGILVGFHTEHKMTFLPLTPGAPPTPASTTIDVAGDGTSGNADGIGSAARFAGLGYIAAAHTAPVWIVGCLDAESLRYAVFTSDVPLRLNVTTLITTPGKQPNGVVMTNDDSILYTAVLNLQQILTVLNPLSARPSLGPVLSVVADGMQKISLHAGCESLLLVGCKGEYLLVYNITSQSTVHRLRASFSSTSVGRYTIGGTVLANGTVIFGGNSSSANSLASWCCLPPYSNSSMEATYTPSVGVVPLAVPSNSIRDIIHDTRSDGLFVTYDSEGIRFLTVNPLTTTSISSTVITFKFIAMVDFIHCSGSIYGLLIAFQGGYKISFLPLTPASPPVGGTIIDVAGDGTNMNADGVGSAARFKGMGYITCAHTAPVWLIGGHQTESIRRALFTSDLPLRLNVTTILSIPGKGPFGVATTSDDSILYASMNNIQQILVVLNPLSSSPTAGATLSITAPAMHKVTLHPGCETVLLVGCSGGALLLYNATSQSIIQKLTAVASASYTQAGVFLANGTILFASNTATPNALVSWCCLSPYDSSTPPAYAPSVPPITLQGSPSNTRDIVHDTRSDGLFLNRYGTGIQYLTLNPFSNTTVYTFTTSAIQSAMVDFIHCSGPIYGILVGFSTEHKMTFLPLTPGASGAPPTPASTTIDVAGDGTSGNADGIGSAARFAGLGYIAAAHTAPVWIVGCLDAESLRYAVFTSDVPLRLNVTTLIATPGKQPNGVVMTNDDSILYTAVLNLQQILTVLNPLSASPSLGPVLLVVADEMHKISLHPGCESLLLVGCQGEYLLVYNITSQSTVHRLRASFSSTSVGRYTIGGTVLANGTVIFGGNSSSANSLASWCCLPPYSNSSMEATYTPSVGVVPLAVPSNSIRDIIHDTRSDGLFVTYDTEGIRFLTVNPLNSTIVSNVISEKFVAMVDFIHCSGPIYGLLIAYQSLYKISFLPLTPASPPVGGTIIDVAGDGTNMNADGVGSAARFKGMGYITCAHTAPVWLIGGYQTESIRRALFTSDLPLRLNVTTVLSIPGKSPFGVATTRDDSILYVSMNNIQKILVVLNPLSSSPTAGATLSIVATNMHKVTVHPGCETVLLVGCLGGALLIYNVTSQSTIRTLTAVKSASYTQAGVFLANGTILFASNTATPNALVSWCCLPPFSSTLLTSYTPATLPVALPASFSFTRDFIHDTRSDGLFSSHSTTGIQYLSLNPISSTIIYSFTLSLSLAMVDIIHCSGPIYGILITHQTGRKMSFLPLVPAAAGAPPIGGTAIDVAGDGTDGNVDGVGSAARFQSLGFTAAAHTAPVWIVGGTDSESIRRATFTSNVPLRLNVTTLIATPTKRPFGVVITNDDSKSYATLLNTQQIQTVLNPLSASPTLGPVLSIVADEMHAISLHPGCESLLLVGCQGEYLLVYNITSQSTIRSIHALDSNSAVGHYTLAGTVLANGTVIFAGNSMSVDGLASWCCLPSYDSTIRPTYVPTVRAIALPAAFTWTRDFVRDTRSEALFSSHTSIGIQYLSLNPVSSTVIYSFPYGLSLAMVDFIHCSGPVYGILITQHIGRKMSFLPLTAAAGTTPVVGTAIDVAGDGTDGYVDGVGSAARFQSMGYTAAAHTAPAWIVADISPVWMGSGTGTFTTRRAVFTSDVPLRLNVTTVITTPSKSLSGVTIKNDDSVLYAAVFESPQIITVLNPLSGNPTLGPALSIVAAHIHKISLHPGCESLLLVGCEGEYLLVYNITSQSTVQSIHALDSYSPDGNYTLAGTVIANGTVIFAGSTASSQGLASWCCLPPFSSTLQTSYTPATLPVALTGSFNYAQDFIHDTRSGGLFSSHNGTGIQYLTPSPLSSTVVYNYTGTLFIAMVDFIYCSGSVYGIIVSQQSGRKMSFLPLTPGAPPSAGTFIDVAGDGTDGNVDGVGSAARFMNNQGYVAAAHTTPMWFLAGGESESIRRAVFTSDVPLRLNVTTLIVTPGKQPFGVVTTNDDSTLYAAIGNSSQIVTVLNPLSANATLGAVLSISATSLHKLTLHPGCESLMLVGCSGDFLLVYNVTSQSTIRSLHSFDSTSGYGQLTMAGAVLPNGTVVFAGYSSSLLGVASWCCLPPYSSSTKATYAPSVGPSTLAVSPAYTRDIIYDTRSDGLFTSNDTDVQYLSFNPTRSSFVYRLSGANGVFLAMVDFITCDLRPIYGILITHQYGRKMYFLPVTPAALGAPPVAGTAIDVAGDGTSGNVDAVGSAARFKDLSFVAAAHTAPFWFVGGVDTESVRLATFTKDIPLRLNVTTLIATPGKYPYGVVTPSDDTVLYLTANSGQILPVLSPLSSNPTLAAALPIAASSLKLSLHPGCESLLLIGDMSLIVYNLTSQTTVHTISGANNMWCLGGVVLSNGSVVFGQYQLPPATWCCLPSYTAVERHVPSPCPTTLVAARPASSFWALDLVPDSRSNDVFVSGDTAAPSQLYVLRDGSLPPLPLVSLPSWAGAQHRLAIVDFIHYNVGIVYGLLAVSETAHCIVFVPLGPYPSGSSVSMVAGQCGVNDTLDNVGPVARFNSPLYIASMHHTPRWYVAGNIDGAVRHAEFADDVSFLNITTVAGTEAVERPVGVAVSNSDNALYIASFAGLMYRVAPLLSTNVSPVLAALHFVPLSNPQKVAVHGRGDMILVADATNTYVVAHNLTVDRSLHLTSAAAAHSCHVFPNGTVLIGFAKPSSLPLGLATWCCLPPLAAPTYPAPFVRYRVFMRRGGVSFSEARDRCKYQGGFLATVPDTQAATLLHEAASPFACKAWLGGSDAAVADEWRWVSDGRWNGTVLYVGGGSPVCRQYCPWASGQPSVSSVQNFVVMDAQSHEWSACDNTCTMSVECYACEFAPSRSVSSTLSRTIQPSDTSTLSSTNSILLSGTTTMSSAPTMSTSPTAIHVSRWVVEPLAGNVASGFADGVGAAAYFHSPSHMCFHPQLGLVLSDTGNNALRLIEMRSGAVSTLVGPTAGFADGPATSARLHSPAWCRCCQQCLLFLVCHRRGRRKSPTAHALPQLHVRLDTGRLRGCWKRKLGNRALRHFRRARCPCCLRLGCVRCGPVSACRPTCGPDHRRCFNSLRHGW